MYMNLIKILKNNFYKGTKEKIGSNPSIHQQEKAK